jgi:hypothetical protein
MKFPACLSSSFVFAASFAAGAFLSSATLGHAQDAVSNLGQGGNPGQADVGNASGMIWQRVFEFTTGSSASSFDFTGATINFAAGGGSPTLSVGLYSSFDQYTVAGLSGLMTNLSLSSGDPLASGDAVFTGTATLAASTTYYLALSAGSPATGNYFTLPVTDAYGEDSGGLSGWSITNGVWDNYPDNFASPPQKWSFDPSVARFSVQATASAVPEPSTYALLAGLVTLGFVAWRRRSRCTA